MKAKLTRKRVMKATNNLVFKLIFLTIYYPHRHFTRYSSLKSILPLHSSHDMQAFSLSIFFRDWLTILEIQSYRHRGWTYLRVPMQLQGEKRGY